MRHTRAHLVRAVLEGVGFGLRDALDLIRAAGIDVADLRASGGGTRSPLWRQILADALDAELTTVGTTEGAAYGAAVLAAVGAGWHRDIEAATDAWITITERTSPGETSDMYSQIQGRYRNLYPALKPVF